MDAGEAHNAEGNAAFKATDFIKAKQQYFKAVQADGKVAKYRTNLCNALLKCNDPGMAVEEAAAAIAVDASWVKGYYFKALALEELGDVARALAACEEGLHLHRHEPALEAMHSRLLKHKQDLDKKQQQRQQLLQQQGHQAAGPAGEQRTVQYCAKVRDAAGHEQKFRFEHQVDTARLARAAADKAEATRIIQEVAMPHYKEMLQAQPWVCVSCQLQHDRRTPATKLFLHPMSYLNKPQPLVQDMGPTPACGAQACATYSTQMAQQLIAEVMREIGS